MKTRTSQHLNIKDNIYFDLLDNWMIKLYSSTSPIRRDLFSRNTSAKAWENM